MPFNNQRSKLRYISTAQIYILIAQVFDYRTKSKHGLPSESLLLLRSGLLRMILYRVANAISVVELRVDYV